MESIADLGIFSPGSPLWEEGGSMIGVEEEGVEAPFGLTKRDAKDFFSK